ncbi:hypothetical protein BC628DRAFT_943818 [Trametes gibbosa]|nr:hypothetical protein BC628DRAFT_943818 [Trametes gibbosa]
MIDGYLTGRGKMRAWRCVRFITALHSCSLPGETRDRIALRTPDSAMAARADSTEYVKPRGVDGMPFPTAAKTPARRPCIRERGVVPHGCEREPRLRHDMRLGTGSRAGRFHTQYGKHLRCSAPKPDDVQLHAPGGGAASRDSRSANVQLGLRKARTAIGGTTGGS